MDFGGSFTTLFHLEILVSTLKLWMLITWIFAIFFKYSYWSGCSPLSQALSPLLMLKDIYLLCYFPYPHLVAV